LSYTASTVVLSSKAGTLAVLSFFLLHVHAP